MFIYANSTWSPTILKKTSDNCSIRKSIFLHLHQLWSMMCTALDGAASSSRPANQMRILLKRKLPDISLFVCQTSKSGIIIYATSTIFPVFYKFHSAKIWNSLTENFWSWYFKTDGKYLFGSCSICLLTRNFYVDPSKNCSFKTSQYNCNLSRSFMLCYQFEFNDWQLLIMKFYDPSRVLLYDMLHLSIV